MYIAQSRTWRFVLIASVMTALWVVMLAADAPWRWRSLPIGITALAVIFPGLFGARAVTRAEAKADVLLDGLDPRTFADSQTRLAELERIRQLVPGDMGRLVAGRMRLWAAARRHDPAVIASMTPAEYYERAATRFLRDAQWRRVVGWRVITSAWDEEAALRTFTEETSSLIPNDVWWREPPIVVGEWATSVQTLVADLAVASFQDAVADRARICLVDATQALLAMAVGDRSDDAKQRQAETAEAMRAAWHALAARVLESYGGTDTAPDADRHADDDSATVPR
jgi:hypothetical protein